jgi:hypothetical protein
MHAQRHECRFGKYLPKVARQVQVTKHGGFEGFESTNGKYFYYSKGRAVPGIWRVPVGGGDESPILEQHRAGMWRYWAITEQGIYFATAEIASHPSIEFFSFTTGKITQVAKLDAPLSKDRTLDWP